MDYPIWAWVGFGVFILGMLSLDLGLFNRKAHVVSYREAGMWSAVWVSLALCFAGIIYFAPEVLGIAPEVKGLKFQEFITGYLIELSLSVDNLFVFLLIFSYFRVPAEYQHRVLFWGVLGALVMRITMIFLGATLINQFHWIIYIFGAFLVYTGIKMFGHSDENANPEENPIVKLVTRFIPISRHYEGENFFTVQDGRRVGTLLLLVLIIVEVTDLVFAVDSIPAIFGITRDPFIVYTSNVFAILGLRSLYFLLAGVVQKFYYLKYGLAVVLTFIGVKMLLPAIPDAAHKLGYNLGIDEHYFHIPINLSLGFVVTTLMAAVIFSLMFPRPAEPAVQIGADDATGAKTIDSAGNADGSSA